MIIGTILIVYQIIIAVGQNSLEEHVDNWEDLDIFNTINRKGKLIATEQILCKFNWKKFQMATVEFLEVDRDCFVSDKVIFCPTSNFVILTEQADAQNECKNKYVSDEINVRISIEVKKNID